MRFTWAGLFRRLLLCQLLPGLFQFFTLGLHVELCRRSLFLLALFAELGLRDTLSRSVGSLRPGLFPVRGVGGLRPSLLLGLIRFRFILHILRAGSQQVIDFSAREPIHKRNGHISIEQQPLAGIAVCDIGKLMLGNTELFCQNGTVTLRLRKQNHKIRVVQNVLDFPAGQKVF